MSHALCDESDCPCAKRAWSEMARYLGAIYWPVYKRARDEVAALPDEAVMALAGLGIPANEAKRRLRGITGTTEERVRAALKE